MIRGVIASIFFFIVANGVGILIIYTVRKIKSRREVTRSLSIVLAIWMAIAIWFIAGSTILVIASLIMAVLWPYLFR